MQLSVGPALVATAVIFSKNQEDLFTLMLYSSFLFFVAAAGIITSYFGVIKLSALSQQVNLSMPVIVLAYGVGIVLIIRGLHVLFVALTVPFGYILLPLAIIFTGAGYFGVVVRLLLAVRRNALR